MMLAISNQAQGWIKQVTEAELTILLVVECDAKAGNIPWQTPNISSTLVASV